MSKSIIGKTLDGIKIADDRKAVLFLIDGGDVIAKTDGECCSCSFIEAIELPALGFPATVMAVEDLLLGSEDEEYGVLQIYGCKISTDKGDILIDFRNESNGYYGGYLSWPEDYFYGGVHRQNVSTQKWVDVEG